MRRGDVFFYGLFMDLTLLREKGLDPCDPERAAVDGFALRIGNRATLVPEIGSSVHGFLCSLTPEELDRLYSQPGLEAYSPHPILVRPESGGTVAALCYNLAQPPAAAERNPEYAKKLQALARQLGLPADYVESIG
jgi:hypothetical protein